jgi:hypothetical protein
MQVPRPQAPLVARLKRGQWVDWLPALARGMVIVLGIIHTGTAIARYSMNADGVAYLDMADAYVRGDWAAAINSVWSPLYAWVLGPILWLARPTMRWQFAVVQLINFTIYLGAFTCFEFYWRQVMAYADSLAAADGGGKYLTLPRWAWRPLGYALFTWTALSLIELWSVTPDMLLSAIVYLAAGLVLRVRQGHATWGQFVMLGGVLGLAYLAKAVMFPLALVALVVAVLSAPRPGRSVGLGLAGLMAFAVVSLPYVAMISQAKGRPTIGEAGRLTFVRYVNGVVYPHWQGVPPGNGSPLHPSRQILDQPPIYEFATPIAGTYPISYDPSYWYDGITARFEAGALAGAALRSTLFYFDLLLRQQGVVLFSLLTLYAFGRWRWPGAHALVRRWGLAVLGLAAFGLYGLVYVEGRYVGVFVMLLWGDLLANVRLPDEAFSRSLTNWLSGAMLAFLLLTILAFNLEGLNTLVGGGAAVPGDQQLGSAPSWPGAVAEELHNRGVHAGESVAIIGYGFDAFWARLAGVRIVAELLGTQAGGFWAGDAAAQARVIAAFATTGAQAIVAEDVPAYARLPRWHQVGDTNYYIYLLNE